MDKSRVVEGLKLLIHAKDYNKRVRQIGEIIADWDDTPMLFAGALEPLNALIDVGLVNRAALDRMLDLATNKRREIPAAKRVDYQRDLMRAKRERLYRAIELEELVRGSKLKGDAKKKYMHDTQAMWMSERNRFIASKGNLTWKERNAAANEYWAQVDERLDKDLAEARQVLEHKPVKRRRVVRVERSQLPTTLSRAFARASLRKRTP
jgi:hypothetical protein